MPEQPKPVMAKWLWIVLIIVILAAGAFAAWYFLMGPGKTSTDNSTSTSTTTKKTTDKTAGWKTYINETQAYSIKYPADWEYKKLSETQTTFSSTSIGGKTPIELVNSGIVLDVVVEDLNTKTLEDWVAARNDEDGKKNTTVDGKTAIQVLNYDTEGNKVTSSATYIENNSKVYSITGSSANKSNMTYYTTILSTFKFITASSEVNSATADWKTYVNDSYGFSFKYPTDWETKNIAAGGLNKEVIGFRPIAMTGDIAGSVTISTETLEAAIAREKKQFSSNSTFNGQSETTFAGKKATKLSFTNNTDRSIAPTIYLVENDSYLYLIGGEGSSNDYEDIIKTLLSTFQFTK